MFELHTWGDIAALRYGRALAGYRDAESGPVRVFGTNGPVGYTKQAQAAGPGVIVGRKGAYRGIHYWDGPFWVIDTAFYLEPGDGLDSRWAYYSLRNTDINGLGSGSAIPSTTREDFYALPVLVPHLSEQRAVAEVLGALDDKIAANVKTVDLLVQHQIAGYEISLLRGLESQPLDKVADFHNRKRVPLSAKERDERPGSIPYYGATGVFGSVDQPLFNDNLVLVGEDGSVITPGGLPVIQYIWGPSWVNNHAHVLTGRSVSTELLRFALSRTNVASLVTGAVQPKISMGKLKGLVLELPTSDELLRLEQLVASEMALLRGTSDETKTLVAMREALLPHLMSGRIRVKEAAQMVGDVV